LHPINANFFRVDFNALGEYAEGGRGDRARPGAHALRAVLANVFSAARVMGWPEPIQRATAGTGGEARHFGCTPKARWQTGKRIRHVVPASF
jgi:hypothetical protein